MKWGEFCLFISVVTAHLNCVQSLIKLKADVIYIQNENTTSALFRCSAGQGHIYYLNHIITWSKIGRDGREEYLSLNWDLVQEGQKMNYGISSQVYTEVPSGAPGTSPEMYFVLGKKELTPDDHGEFICRLHDFDRNILAEESVPMIVFDGGLALSPYQIVGGVGKDIAINCMQNTSITNDTVVIHHVDKSGVSRTIVEDGTLVNGTLKSRYAFMTRDNGDRIVHNILTLKGSTTSDEGYYVCEMTNGTNGSVSTNASITIGVPKMKVSPLYFLQVPTDAIGHFKCGCEIMDTAACINNDIVWSLVDPNTGVRKDIYKGGQLLDTTGMYTTIVGQNGTSVNLTINGLLPRAEGDYVCSLQNKTTGTEVATASIPVTTTPVSLGALSLVDNYPDNIRFLCTLSGSMWDNHYFDDHEMAWVRTSNGVEEEMASNGALHAKLDPARFSVVFDSQRYYSVFAIQSVLKSDYGDYKCVLKNSHTKVVLKEKILKMYGKGNITLFTTVSR